MLARLCQPQTHQPTINELVEFLYTDLIKVVLYSEFPKSPIRVPTRMTLKHPTQFLESDVLNVNQRAITVNLARAGTFPSHICYNLLNYILNPEVVRQDHVTAARQTDENLKVVGTSLAGSTKSEAMLMTPLLSSQIPCRGDRWHSCFSCGLL